MFQAQAVWLTDEEGVFRPAGFSHEVDLSINHELGTVKTQELMALITQGACDGFEIDYGTGKAYIVRSTA